MHFPEAEGLAIVGRSEAEKLQDLLGRLRQHMEMQHPEQYTMAALMADRTLAFGVLVNFAIPDGPVALWRTQAAATVHQLVGRQLPNERILQAVERYPIRLEGRQEFRRRARLEIAALVRQMRDWLNYADVLQATASERPA